MADITLSAAVRNNLLSLQNTGALIGETQTKLSTGQKVSSVIDDAVAYFQAKALSDRASDFSEKKAGIDQGINTLKASLNAIESIEKIVRQMKGILLSAKSTTDETERTELKNQFNELAKQVTYLANDASYQGLNLVNATATKLTVQFSDATDARLEVEGKDIVNASGLYGSAAGGVSASLSNLGTTLAGSAFDVLATQLASNVTLFDNAVLAIDQALSTLRSTAKSLGSNVALLQTRLEFTKNYVNSLEEGAGKLTLADLNEEGANLVALQTRQQLGMQALSFAGQSDQAVLQLFR